MQILPSRPNDSRTSSHNSILHNAYSDPYSKSSPYNDGARILHVALILVTTGNHPAFTTGHLLRTLQSRHGG